jgi:hypothetical protein
MAKPVLCVLLALCLAAPVVALGKVAVTGASPCGAAVSASAGKHLVSSLGGSIEGRIPTTDCRAAFTDATRALMGETPSREQVPGVGLRPNCPNPFGPTTTVSYYLREPARVVLTVHDVSGRVIATLADGTDQGGQVRNIQWTGANESGDELPSGVYFLRMVTEHFDQTRKMVLLR